MNVELIFGAIAVVTAVLLIAWSFVPHTSAARSNLMAGVEEASEPTPPIVKTMQRIGAAIRRWMPNALVDGLEVNIVQAGYPGGFDLPRILGLKVLLAAAGAIVLLLYQQIAGAIIVGLVLFFLPDYWVLSTRDKRQTRLALDLADVVDQLTICVEAGLGFDAALARVARPLEGPLGEELRHTLRDISAGVPRSRALRALADRAQIPEIRQLVSSLLQAQKHGVSVADTLRIQAGEMRLRRRQRTEEQAAKLPVKMIFPIVVCYLPVFMIIVMVPAVLTIFRAL